MFGLVQPLSSSNSQCGSSDLINVVFDGSPIVSRSYVLLAAGNLVMGKRFVTFIMTLVRPLTSPAFFANVIVVQSH